MNDFYQNFKLLTIRYHHFGSQKGKIDKKVST